MADVDTTTTSKGPGRGWRGDSAGHARAGRLGGKVSRGNFKYNRERARAAGKRRQQLNTDLA